MLTFINKDDIISLSNEREVNQMEVKRNYVIYVEDNNRDIEEQERVIRMTAEQAQTIRWFMYSFDIDGTVELAEIYEGEEI